MADLGWTPGPASGRNAGGKAQRPAAVIGGRVLATCCTGVALPEVGSWGQDEGHRAAEPEGRLRGQPSCTLQHVHNPVCLVDWADRASLSHHLPPVSRAPNGDACLGRLAAMHVRWGVAPRAPVQGMTRRRGGLAAKAKEGIMTEDVEWFAGVDWASQTHQV